MVWPTSFRTLLQHFTFHADWSHQTKVSVDRRGCSKVGNVTLKTFPISIGFNVNLALLTQITRKIPILCAK